MLLQAFFFEYMPKLIQNGHLYRVMTPLYENVLRGGSTVLAYNDAEQDAIVEKHGKSIVETLRNKGLGEIGDEKTGLWMNTPGTRSCTGTSPTTSTTPPRTCNCSWEPTCHSAASS